MVYQLNDRTGVARLSGTRRSDPVKISLTFHQGNDYNLLHSLEFFIVQIQGESVSLPTTNLSSGLQVSEWTIILIYFILVHSMSHMELVACKNKVYQAIYNYITHFNK